MSNTSCVPSAGVAIKTCYADNHEGNCYPLNDKLEIK